MMSSLWFPFIYSIALIKFIPGATGLIQFLQEPSSVIVPPSDPLWWHCRARLVGTNIALTITWSRGDTALSSSSNVEVVQNGTLHVRAVGPDDTGLYSCRAQGGGEVAFTDGASLTMAALGASFTTSPLSVSVTLGNPLSFECSIVSNPPATITWQQNGAPVMEGDIAIATGVIDTETRSTLQVASVDHRHGGQYSCLATNGLLEGQMRFSETATVTLIGRPGFSTSPSPQVAIVSSSVTFQCTTTGTPAATIIWQDGNEDAIQNSQRFLVSSSSLRITNVQLSDGGYYTCKAVNEYGENKASALLTVTDSFAPVAFTLTPVDNTVEVGGRVTFKCEAQGIPSPTITWSKVGGAVPVERTDEPAAGWLRISNIEVDDAGVYVCMATNGLSTSSQSAQLTVQERPRFVTVPDDITILAGETALLDCLADGSPEPEISWNTPLSSLGILQTPSSPISTLEVAGNGSLLVSPAGREHVGTYTCIASNTVSRITTEVRVTVQGPPVITQVPRDVTVIEGAAVMLTCRAVAVPAILAVAWTFKSEQLTTNLRYEVFGNGDLRINNIRDDQEGVYSCQADNAIGSSPTVAAYVTVHVPPMVEVRPTDVTVDLGSNVTIFCSATGDPTPALQWKKDGENLVLSDNIAVLADFTLEVVGLRKENTGSYQCRSRNEAGVAQATAVIMTPDIPEIISPSGNVTANQSQSGVLPCRATAREPATIRWYLSDASGRRGEEIGQGENVPGTRGFQSTIVEEGDLVIGAVSMVEEGWYLCRAQNSIGAMEQLIYLSVNYPASVTTTLVQISGSGTATRAVLTCEMDGRPQPSARWFFPSRQEVDPVENRYFINDVGSTSYLIIYRPEVALHDGDFRCQAGNVLGSESVTITVSVEGVPVIVEVSAEAAPSSVTLRCLSKGSPSPETFWSRDSSLANLMPRHSVLVDGALVVTDLAAAERGHYSCQLQNRHGVASASLQAPPSPAPPQIDGITPRAISLSWTPPAPNSDLSIDSYEVQYHSLGTNTSAILTGFTEGTGATVEALSPYTGYRFQVRSRNGLGASEFSDPSELVFTSEDVPDAVRDLSLQAVGSSILVSWTEPTGLNGNHEHIIYEIVYGPIVAPTSDHVTFRKVEDGTPVQLLADLEPATIFRVAVRVQNTFLEVWSDEVVGQVMTGYPAPIDVLQGVKVVTNDSDSILVTWRPLTVEDFTRYIISYRETASAVGHPDITVNDTTVSQYLIADLTPGTAYAVRMSYETEGGVAPYTPEEIVQTLEDQVLQEAQSSPLGPIIGGVFGALLLVLLALLLALLLMRWKRSKDKFEPAPATFDPDSLWINRRFSYGDTVSLDSTADESSSERKRGTYEVSAVNRNFDPSDTMTSNDSEYDLGAGPSGGHLDQATPGSRHGGRMRKKGWNDDVIYKDPLNPEVVLVKKAVIGDESPPKIMVNDREMHSEDGDETANTSGELIHSNLGPAAGRLPSFHLPHPNEGSDDKIVSGNDTDTVLKDNSKQARQNKKSRREQKRQQKAQQKERDRDFDIGYRRNVSVANMFNVWGMFSRRKESVDDIPYPEVNEGAAPGAHGDSAVLY